MSNFRRRQHHQSMASNREEDDDIEVITIDDFDPAIDERPNDHMF